MPKLSIQLLGPFTTVLDGEPVAEIRANSKVQALLACLAVERKRPQRREALMALLWPGMPEKSARHNLSQTLYMLRNIFPQVDGRDEQGGVPLVLADRRGVQLNPEASMEVDVHRLEELLQDPAGVGEAAALYRGDFLSDFYLEDSSEFEAWAGALREVYRGKLLDGLAVAADVGLREGDFKQARAYAGRQLELDPLRERAHRQLLEALARSGDRTAVLVRHQAFRELLRKELGIEPGPETEMLVEAIRDNSLARLEPAEKEAPAPSADEPASPQPQVRHNLPVQPTPFIGREKELEELDALLTDPQTRLVTIVGPGGMGKTRLALAAAEGMLGPYGDGVFFVDLAPLSGPDQIVSAVADALHFPLQVEEERTPRRQLLDYLRHQNMLLVFDNFEHLLEGVDLPADILQAAPGVRILATSRERLHIRSEQVYLIDGLEFPDWETPADAAEYTAVQLFLQSARRNRSNFELGNGEDLTYLARICRLVAGMPLAIELAASWVDALPLFEIAAGLQEGLDFLETDMRDVPERHRSIRAAIDYSWGQLDEKEQDIFAKLSVFRGGFTRQAAQAVAGANLRQLGRLVNKSFLQYDQAPDRYRVHDLMRQYGAERLEKSGLETEVRDLHSRFFCSAFVEWEERLQSEDLRQAAIEIEADYGNVKTAWEVALDENRLERLLLAVNGLGTYFDVNSRWFEGIGLIQDSYQRLKPNKGKTPLQGETARLLIWLAAWQSNLSINAARGWMPMEPLLPVLEFALGLLDAPVLADVESLAEEAYLRLQLGRILKSIDGQWEAGRIHLTVCLERYRELGDRLGLADALYESHFYASDKEQAQSLMQEALAILQQEDDPRRLNRVLVGMGHLSNEFGASDQAAVWFDKAYKVAQTAEYRDGMFDALINQALNLQEQGQVNFALQQAQETLALARQMNAPPRIWQALNQICLAQLYLGQFLHALDTFEQAELYEKEKSFPDSYIGGGWERAVYMPQIALHTGQYAKVLSYLEIFGDGWWIFVQVMWVSLVQRAYENVLSLNQQAVAAKDKQNPGHRKGVAEIGTPAALAIYELGRKEQARRDLIDYLGLCLEIRAAFIQLMPLIPVIARVLADAEDEQQRLRAVELWAMAQELPFVGNSKMFADLLGERMDALERSLPADQVAGAQEKGRGLDWWETAEVLLGELTAWGWGEDAGTGGDLRTGGSQTRPDRPHEPSIRHNLPAQPTPFIGREKELEELDALLADPGTRLVTIVGPGGMGKTRLALAAAERIFRSEGRQSFFALDGVFFIDLAPLNEAGQIPLAIGGALEIQLTGGEVEVEQQLVEFLHDRQMLLLMDNFQHLLGDAHLLQGAALVSGMLEAAPGVKFLVTSHERLRLRSEQLYPIGGLDFPEEDNTQEVGGYSAAGVFTEAARRIRPGFEPGEGELPHLAHICRLVGGMPLALELAAGWVELLSLEEIAAEVERGLELLETDLQDIPDRQRSLQAVFEYSWERLASEDRNLMKQISVFRGGFTRQAAAQVAGGQSGAAGTLRSLGRLVSKSLLQADPEIGRYQAHELLRQFALGRLEEDGGLSAARSAHSAYYLDLLQKQEEEIKGSAQMRALATIAADFANIRYAWRWAITENSPDSLEAALETLFWFCYIRSRELEGAELFRLVEERFGRSKDHLSIPLWRKSATRRIYLLQSGWPGDIHNQLAELEAILSAAQVDGDLAEIAFVLQTKGLLSDHAGNLENIIHLYEESRSLYHAAGDTFTECYMLGGLSFLYLLSGHAGKWRELLQKQYDMAVANGDQMTAMDAQGTLGQHAAMMGRYQEAESVFFEALTAFREFGDLFHHIQYHLLIGELDFLKGDNESAEERLSRAKLVSKQAPKTLVDWMEMTASGTEGMILNSESMYQNVLDLVHKYPVPDAFSIIAFYHEKILAYALCGLGDLITAKTHLANALEKSVYFQAIAWQVQMLPCAALIAGSEGQLERAAELVALAFHHPAAATGWLEKFPLVVRLRERLEAELSGEVFEAAWERGKSLDLAETVAALIALYDLKAGQDAGSET